MQELRERSWIATSDFGYVVLDREAAGFFLRSRKAEFPGVYMFDLLGITDGPLRSSLSRNILTLGGEQHARLRALVQPSFTPKAADKYRPAMREFLDAALGAGRGPRAAATSCATSRSPIRR